MKMALLPQPLIERVARRFKLLGEPARLHLLNQLHMKGELSVNELVEQTGLTQANVSKHLLMLANEGLLGRRKDGLYVYYRIEDPTLHSLCLLVCGRIREEAADDYADVQQAS